MGGNATDSGKKDFLLTVRGLMKGLAILGIVFVFCPSFVISCSGEKVNVSAMNAAMGISMYDQEIVEANPIMFLCLLIPVAVLILLFVKKMTDKLSSGIIAGCLAVDIVIWFVFLSAAADIASENWCGFEVTIWYMLNMVVLFLILLGALLAALGKIGLDMELNRLFADKKTQETLKQVSSVMDKMSGTLTQIAGSAVENVSRYKKPKENVIGYCAKCGSGILYGSKFCTECGTPVPETMIAEAEAARKTAEEEAARKAAEEEAARKATEEEAARIAAEEKKEESAGQKKCPNCGAILEDSFKFCTSCGTKVE